ncbi:MAG TPA: HAMP domain-containing sensor histidine kinase [Thermoleophilaceae bacterium]|nr:HAMP domain-containing sensor histidine kinase [Thermoleophilaceae bacterium]
MSNSPIRRARLRLPIRVKLATVSAALTLVILCLFAIVIGAVAEQRIRAGFDDDLRATAADLQDALQSSGNVGLDARGEQEVAEALRGASAGGALVRVVSRGGQVLYPRGELALGLPGLDGVTDIGDFRVVSRPLVSSVEAPSLFSPPGPLAAEAVAYVQYAKPERSVQRTVNKLRVFLGLGVIGGTALAFLGGLFVARRAMRPIMGLTRAAREVARTRDPDITLPSSQANDEVADLARTFEDMLRQLSAARAETEDSLQRQRQFVADASHELRTPLTSILANLELLEAELAGEQRDMAGSALRSSKRMRRLVADLLLLARADAGRRATTRPVDLAAVAAEAATEAGALSAEHPLSLDLPEPVIVEGAGDDLHRLVANLVENALVHTPPGTPVTVSVRREGEAAVLEVADRGPGVPAEMRQRVFERFARAGGDSAPAGSSGLGLAIVRAVADAHGGRVELCETQGQGARFVVTLPALPAVAAAARGADRPSQEAPADQIEPRS